MRVIFESAEASGAVALVGGDVVGYLLGAPKQNAVWGPNLWMEAASHAVLTAEHIRDLYAFAARRWVDEGRTAHYVLMPTYDPAVVDAWNRLAFGQQHMHAVREPSIEEPPGLGSVLVRRACRDDIPALAALEVALPEHQGLSPVFSAGEIPALEATIAEWEEDFDDPAYAVFVAESGGVVIGSAVGCSIEKSGTHLGMARLDSAGFLGFAAVFPQYRGMGAGRALGETVLRWASDAGYPAVVTDWRVTNLLSSRAWPALGFRPTFVRMHRLIGY